MRDTVGAVHDWLAGDATAVEYFIRRTGETLAARDIAARIGIPVERTVAALAHLDGAGSIVRVDGTRWRSASPGARLASDPY